MLGELAKKHPPLFVPPSQPAAAAATATTTAATPAAVVVKGKGVKIISFPLLFRDIAQDIRLQGGFVDDYHVCLFSTSTITMKISKNYFGFTHCIQ